MVSKPIFILDDYIYPNMVVMHCKTNEEATGFLNFLNEHGRTWRSGGSYLSHTNFSEYEGNTCYNFIEGCYDDLLYYQRHGYTILEYSEFNWESADIDISYESFLNIISA